MQRFERATAEGGKIGSFFLWAHSFLFEPRYPRSHLDMDYCLLVLFFVVSPLGIRLVLISYVHAWSIRFVRLRRAADLSYRPALM